MRLTDTTRAARGLALTIGGEAMQSGFHFALNLALVHMLGARDFGVFSIVLVIGGLSLTYIRAFTGMPASISIGRSRLRAAANGYDVTFGSGAIVLSVLAAIGVDLLLHVWLDNGELAGGCFVGLWSMRSYMRTAYFAYGRRSLVVLADFCFVLSGAIFACAFLFVPKADLLQSAFLVLVGANAIGIGVMLSMLRRPFRISFRRQIRRRYLHLWRQLGWSGLSATLANVQGQIVSLLVTVICGPAAYAPIAAMLLLFVPLRVAGAAVVNMVQPEMSAEIARGEAHKLWHQIKFWSAIIGCICILYGIAMIALVPRLHLHLLEGVPVRSVGVLVWALFTITVLYILPRIALEVMTAFSTISFVMIAAALVGCALVLFLLTVAPPIWAVAGGLASETVAMLGLWIAVYRKLNGDVAGGETGTGKPDLLVRARSTAAPGEAHVP